jgi:hypothetical protein
LCSGLTTTRIIFDNITYSDIDVDKSWAKNNKIGINKTGFGQLYTYNSNLSDLCATDVRKLLEKHSDKLLTHFKNNKRTTEILQTFKENISPLKIIDEVKFKFKLPKETFDGKSTYGNNEVIKTNSPHDIGYEVDIKLISDYIAVEYLFDNIRKIYNEIIISQKENNTILETQLSNLKNAFSSFLIIEAL